MRTIILMLMMSTALPACAAAPKPRAMRDVVGVAHVAGKYNFTNHDFLNEGADALLEMGTRVIKVWFVSPPKDRYPFNSNWPKVQTLTELAKTPYYRALFAKPFTTFMLETYRPSAPDHYYCNGMSSEDVAAETEEMRELTAYLLNEYRGNGKTFIIQNWEGDWSLRGGSPSGPEPTQQAVQGMIDWLNARQAGVRRARMENSTGGVTVLHAAEVNHVTKAMARKKLTMTNDVLPHTHCDLYSYSAYDVPTYDPKKFREALDYLDSKAPGEDNVYVGEFGAPENIVGGPDVQIERTRATIDTALKWGAKYVIYWQLYCNEPKPDHKFAGRPDDDDLRGFWLVRPDGSRPPVTDYLIELWNRD